VPHIHYSKDTPDGFFLLSACKDGKPMIRDGKTGDWIGTFVGHKGAVWCARLDPKALKAVTGSADYSVKVWDSVTGNELHSLKHDHIVKGVDFNPDGSKIVTGTRAKMVRIFDLGAIDKDPQVLAGHTGAVNQVLYNGDTNSLVTGAEDKTVRVWDTRSGDVTHMLNFEDSVSSIELSKDEKTWTIGHHESVSIYDAQTFALVKTFDVKTPVYTVALSPDKSTFVAGGQDFCIHVFDYASGEETSVFKGHHGPVHSIEFSPDGQVYASGSDDSTVRLWQTNVGQEYGLWTTNNK